MTETTETTAAPESNGSAAPARKGGGLSSMLLPELKQVAAGLGIKATGMKKAELVAAIRAAQGNSQGNSQRNGQAGGSRGERPAREDRGGSDRSTGEQAAEQAREGRQRDGEAAARQQGE